MLIVDDRPMHEPFGPWLVVEMPKTGGEPQQDFATEGEAKAFIHRRRDGLNPFSGRPLAEHPYEYHAESLIVSLVFRPSDPRWREIADSVRLKKETPCTTI